MKKKKTVWCVFHFGNWKYCVGRYNQEEHTIKTGGTEFSTKGPFEPNSIIVFDHIVDLLIFIFKKDQTHQMRSLSYDFTAFPILRGYLTRIRNARKRELKGMI